MAFKTVRYAGIVEVKDPGNGNAIPIPDHHHMVCALGTGGAETRDLGAPAFFGQRCSLSLTVDGGNCTVTVTSTMNETGNNTIIFENVGEAVDMVGTVQSGVLVWRGTVADPTSILSTV